MTKNLKKYFWLALLAHLLFFLSVSLSLVFEPELQFEKKSDHYLPAYLYQKESAAQEASPKAAQAVPTEPSRNETEALSKEALALKKQEPQQKTQPTSQSRPQTRSSAAFVEAESLKSGKPQDEPLLKELTRATAAKLFYPSEAAAFRIRGMVTISFLLYPDGRVAEVSIAKSSGFRVLDEAALNTIKAISPVRDANMYLTKPRYLLAGIIFG
jgi:TonB family protein